jgi:poly(hydroxyalkanoate) depolymerase family esterase
MSPNRLRTGRTSSWRNDLRVRKTLCALVLASISTLSAAALTSTTTTITSSVNPSTYGQTVKFTAAVSSTSGAPPNGETITFLQGSTTIGTGTLSGGKATFSISTLKTGGSDPIKAKYPGDATFGSSTSSTLAQVVDQATTTTHLSPSQTKINIGQSVTLTATVNAQFGSTVVGNVAFYHGSKKLGTVALASGTASFTSSTLPVGTDQLTATYNGNSSYVTSTSAVLDEVVGTGTTTNATMQWNGITRYYQLFVPTVLPENPPLLLMLHGTSFEVPPANPSTESWNWQSVADLYGFILVQPASTYNSNTGQWNWDAYFMDASFQTPPDDSGFLRQLIVNLSSQYKVNPNMVFVTGFSSGAQMTERVGVEISDLVAAIAPTSGQLVGQQTPPPTLPNPAIAPVSVQEWHGTADTQLPPCNNGTTKYSGVIYTLDTVDDTYNYWVQQNSCTTQQTTEPLCTDGKATAGLSGNIATGCVNSNIEVQFIWESGTAHAWLPNNNVARWQFLSAHPKQ